MTHIGGDGSEAMAEKMLTAEEARKIATVDVAKNQNVEALVEFACGRIRAEAQKGSRSVAHPFYGLRLMRTTNEERAAFRRLEAMGYEVKHHRGDHSDPRECDYDEVTW